MEENHNNRKQIREKVLEVIKNGQVKMRPKWHFILKASLIITGAIAAFLISLYLASFIIFVLHQTGVWFAPAFGFPGFGILMSALPIVLIGVLLIFIAVIEILARRYSFTYRQPFLYSALGVIALVVVGGFAVAQTSLHRGLFIQASEDRLPVVGGFYRGFGEEQFEQIHPGVILSLDDGQWVLSNHRGEVLNVLIDKKTAFPFGEEFNEGDQVVVFGERVSSTVNAFGVRKVGDDVEWKIMHRSRDIRRPSRPGGNEIGPPIPGF